MKNLQQPQALSIDRALELLAMFVIATGLIGLMAALSGVFYAPQVLLAALLTVFGYAWWTRGCFPDTMTAPRGYHLLLILLVALCLRVPAYNYVLGGQDEGVYVNMAADLARTGSIVPRDAILQTVRDQAAVERYLQDNYAKGYLPGVYRTVGDPPRLEFQFYHLFPVWMALFAGLFGLGASVYALSFLALVSLLFFYRLTLALTDRRPAALVAGLLLAVNPLHAFFSKFPVTEVPTLSFSVMGFTFLAIYWRAAGAERQHRWLVLAALSFLCLFTTRISGFMYLPFLLLLSVATLLCDTDPARRNTVHGWVLAVVGLYTLSVMYGLTWSGFYSRTIYLLSFEELFGAHWKAGIWVCVLVALLGWLAIWIGSGSDRIRGALSRRLIQARSLLGPAVLLILLLGTYKVYQLGFTNRYVGDPWLGQVWKLAAAGWHGVAGSSLVVSAVYLSPFLFLAFLLLALRRWREPLILALLFFLMCFFAYVALLNWTIPYQPYYARYLVSEFVPYAILFVVCAWAYLQPGRLRTALAAVLLLSGLYSVVLSAAQVGKQENEGAYESLARLAAHVDGGDLLLIGSDSAGGFTVSNELKTPLVYTFGLQVASINAASLADWAYLSALRTSYDDLYLVSFTATPPEGFVWVDSVRFRVMDFRKGLRPPTSVELRVNTRLYLYRLAQIKFAAGARIDFRPDGPGNDWLQTGWSQPEPWGVWAMGQSAKLRINPQAVARDAAITGLRLELRAYVSPQHPEQHVVLRLDGVEMQQLYFHYPDATELRAELPLNVARLRESRPIVIEFVMPQSVSPESLGQSADPRVLGVGLKSLELVGDGTR